MSQGVPHELQYISKELILLKMLRRRDQPKIHFINELLPRFFYLVLEESVRRQIKLSPHLTTYISFSHKPCGVHTYRVSEDLSTEPGAEAEVERCEDEGEVKSIQTCSEVKEVSYDWEGDARADSSQSQRTHREQNQCGKHTLKYFFSKEMFSYREINTLIGDNRF